MAVGCTAVDDRGPWLAHLLAGAWRASPGTPALSVEQVDQVLPRLLTTGAAGLGWWRLRGSSLGQSRPAVKLLQGYRLHALEASLHDEALHAVIRYLRAAGVEPVLAKGWAVARLYPNPALRPYGDLDVYVLPRQYAAAAAALALPQAPACAVDLHRGIGDLQGRRPDPWYSRTQVVWLGGVEVRLLSPEDQLRLSCLHLLRHGAWRPLWLCDCGLLVEARSAAFDWDYCLRGDRRLADAVLCALGLAHRILGAHLDGTPAARRAESLPRWLVPAVLRQWCRTYQRYTDRPLLTYLRHPAEWLRALGRRWPNPVEATLSIGAPFNEVPRLLFQLADCVSRAAAIVVRRGL